ncbi:hypothetical protein PIB30_096812 [Stylosanthes scabra]|uniref:Uncharacterized protein n=1 Tax=Stylosanthes scabra TaxID=79078 RepID=A0ABU6TXL4_9FABA|nr:hypothetical protein [Stylosanthes scabra]
MLVQPSKLHKQLLNSARVACATPYGACATNSPTSSHIYAFKCCVRNNGRNTNCCMDRKRNQAALKRKEKLRAPPTRMSPRLAALRAPHSPPLKMKTPPSRASPRLAALKDSPLQPSPTSVLMPKKLVVLALAVPKPILLPVTHVQKVPETPILEIPRVPIRSNQFGANSPKGLLLKEDHP